MTANELSSTTRQHVLADMRHRQQEGSTCVCLVSVVPEDDHEMNMQLP